MWRSKESIMPIIVIKKTRVMQTMPPFGIADDVDVVIKDDIITAVGKGAGDGLKADKFMSGITQYTGHGMSWPSPLLIPGSRGPPHFRRAAGYFIQVLKEWWWRLDRGLDEEATYYSSLICSLDAIAAGTTTCIDHHASPNYIANSLDTIAKGMEEVGVRGTTCYEVTDRNFGMKKWKPVLRRICALQNLQGVASSSVVWLEGMPLLPFLMRVFA